MVTAQSSLFASRCVCDRPIPATKGISARPIFRKPTSWLQLLNFNPLCNALPTIQLSTTISGSPLSSRTNSPEAVAELRKAESLGASQPDAPYTLGVTLWQQGLGSVLKQQGKPPEAAAALREAIRLQPDFAGAHTTLAAVLHQSGDTAGAAAESRGQRTCQAKDQ
jgi:tetratricopeptide (TPR) repeat protein